MFQVNLGNQVFDSLRGIQHSTHLSRNYIDQLMEPKPVFEELRKYLNLCGLFETNNGVPAIDSYEVKVKFVGMFGSHAQRWLVHHVRDETGELVHLWEEDGMTAEEYASHMDTYYAKYLNAPGKRYPKQSTAMTAFGQGKQPGKWQRPKARLR